MTAAQPNTAHVAPIPCVDCGHAHTDHAVDEVARAVTVTSLWNQLLNLSFPIFDGFRVRSNVELAQAQYRVAALQLQQQRETVALEVARARAELRRARAAYEATQQNSGEAREAFQLAQLRFTRGLTTQLEVSDAQLALLTAQSTEARATYDLFLASADLARALGRPIPLPPMTTSPSAPR